MTNDIKRTYVMPLVVLTAICLVVSGALAFMDSITGPVILAAAEERAQMTMADMIPNATSFERVELDDVGGLPTTIREIYKTSNGVGFIFIAAVNGFSGDITVICAVAMDGSIIETLTLSHTETKGIGTILEQESFLYPFTGLDSRLEGIDTVAGATISTRAFIRAIEDIMEAFYLVEKG
ncbi:MAG: FMN-binding protein [Oscillospiraceae bacterium]|nr:FMN-binding protein [Oscillospiraceae bacterium]